MSLTSRTTTYNRPYKTGQIQRVTNDGSLHLQRTLDWVYKEELATRAGPARLRLVP